MNVTFGGCNLNFRILKATDSYLHPKLTILITLLFCSPNSFKQIPKEHLRLTHCSIILHRHESIIPAINALEVAATETSIK
jgi:hypothetical protein